MSDRRRDRLRAWVTRKLHSKPSTPDLSDASAIAPSQSTTTATSPTSILPHAGGSPKGTLANNATSTSTAGRTPSSMADPAKSQPKSDLVVDNLTVTLALVQQVANIIKKVPWIAPVAALMSELLEAYKVCSNDASNNTTARFLMISSHLGSQGYKRETGWPPSQYH
jgi:hypothetical protein